MGCGGSSGSDPCPDEEKLNWKDASEDSEFDKEVSHKRKHYDSAKGKPTKKEKEKPDEGFAFEEGADAGSGEKFMSVRPFEAYIKDAPANAPEENKESPDLSYELEHIYGYRCEDSRQNVYFNADGKVVYMTAAVGVILDAKSNKQTFFGSGEVDNKSKQRADDKEMHTDDITSLGISKDRKLAVSGQNGSRPVAFIWDACKGEKEQRYKLFKGGRSVKAAALSEDGSMVALVCNDNDHTVLVHKTSGEGDLVMREKGGPDPIFDCYWSQKEGEHEFVTAGKKHFKWWWPDDNRVKKALYMGKGKPTSHSCATFDEEGTAYTGGCNSRIYVWKGRELEKNYRVHNKGFVSAIMHRNGKLYSGGKDKQIIISNPESEEAERTIKVDHLVRALDVEGDTILAGLINGSIFEIKGDDQKEIMSGHCKGEAWGLCILGNDKFITSGDDNLVKVWCAKERKCISTAEVCDENAKPKKGAASSLTDLAASKCSRAVAYDSHSGHIAVAHNDGRVTIRESVEKLDTIVDTLRDSAEWIEVMDYSPCGKYLAVGSHDDNIYVYKVDGYKLHGTAGAHNSFLVSLDWSQNSEWLKSVCGAHELLWFKVTDDGVEHAGDGFADTKEVEWNSHHAKYGWNVTGIFPSGCDGTHINDVDMSKDQKLIVTGDDYGLVNVWRNPARGGSKPLSFRGHSEHVIRTRFMDGDDYIISIGGYDKTVFQWKKK